MRCVRAEERPVQRTASCVAGDLNSYIGMRDLGVFSAPTQFETQTVLAVQTAVPRTLDLSANGFAGEFPNWLVQGLIAAPENVAVNLTVCCAVFCMLLQHMSCIAAMTAF